MNGKQLLYRFEEKNDGEILHSFKLEKFRKLNNVEWLARITINKRLQNKDIEEIKTWYNWLSSRNIPCIMTKTNSNYSVYKEPFQLTQAEINQIEMRK